MQQAPVAFFPMGKNDNTLPDLQLKLLSSNREEIFAIISNFDTALFSFSTENPLDVVIDN